MPGHKHKRGVKLPRKPAPYGRRADSAPLIGDPDLRLNEYGPDWIPDVGYDRDGRRVFYEKRCIPMPRDRGYRQLVKCPKCDRWVKGLWGSVGSGPLWCRHCWGLRYPSQYYGRRPECDPERMMTLLAAGGRARKRGNEALAMRRATRFLEAMDTYQARYEVAELARIRSVMAGFDADMAAIDRAEARWQREHPDDPHGGGYNGR